ncbi:transposase, partial [Vibrio splendidus]
AFDLEVQAHCPNAKVVYDLFHVVAKFGREVMDRVRAYILGAQLKELWYCESEVHAKGLWEAWWAQVQESGIKPLKEFARKLSPYLHGILASASYPLNTCTLEGINNKIKLIKRMGYGYRDTDYFFLKIKAAFPGKPR